MNSNAQSTRKGRNSWETNKRDIKSKVTKYNQKLNEEIIEKWNESKVEIIKIITKLTFLIETASELSLYFVGSLAPFNDFLSSFYSACVPSDSNL